MRKLHEPGDTAFDPEFDTAYLIDADGAIWAPAEPAYLPSIDLDDSGDVLIDGVGPEYERPWHLVTGYSAQYGYAGPIMHSSEQWGPWAVDELSDLAEDTASGFVMFYVAPVNAHSDTEPVFFEEPDYCETYGCAHPPAGWAVAYRLTV